MEAEFLFFPLLTKSGVFPSSVDTTVFFSPDYYYYYYYSLTSLALQDVYNSRFMRGLGSEPRLAILPRGPPERRKKSEWEATDTHGRPRRRTMSGKKRGVPAPLPPPFRFLFFSGLGCTGL